VNEAQRINDQETSMKNRRTAQSHPRHRVFQRLFAVGAFEASPGDLSLAWAQPAAALVEIVRRPHIREKIFARGWQVASTSPEGLENRVRTDTRRMRLQ